MDQQRWEIIKEVFDTALELPSSEREAFILAASEGDAEVYSELKSLIQADEDAGDFLETPILAGSAFEQLAVPEQPFQPGEMLCQRFRILRAVGEGGMGYVFEAWDTELRRSVALKAIRPEIASHPESLKRFRQEVSLALSITHPNVCRTFDIEREARVVDATTGRTQEVVFLTMEFLQGETLAARLSRTGALPLDEGLRIARQIADALTCAHDLGIYHRDIKPANVMLVPAAASQSPASSSSPEFPRAVITDFGLARQEAILRSDGLSGVSSSGIPLGTFAYMAPEQLECAETSAATDIYAFGLVLFEMVTGKRAFSSSNPLSGIKLRLTGPAPSPQSLAPNLPEAWCRAIEGCLRSDPAERLQRAADVVAILDGERDVLPPVRTRKFISHGPTTRQLARAPWSIRRRISALAAILVIAVSLLIGGLRLYQSKTDSKVTPGALVYLTQVKNQTGEKTFDNLTELIQAGLTQSAQINLLDQGRVGDILQQMTKSPDTVITEPIAREIALRAGAPRVVFATVTGTNGSYKLNIDIQQPDASSPNRYRDHWTRSFEWQRSGDINNQSTIPQELLTTVRKTSDWIRLETGESANDIARLDTPPEDVTTASWKALDEYTGAVKLQSRQQTENAIEMLQQAVKIDPSFALAWGQLGDLQYDQDRFNDGDLSYEQALRSGLEKRLTRREKDRILGEFALDTQDYQAAEEAFRDYSLFYKNDYLGFFGQGRPLLLMGRFDEAANTLHKALAMDKTNRSPALQLICLYITVNDLAKAQELANDQESLGRTGDAGKFQGEIAFLALKFQQSASYFRAMQSSSDPFARTMSLSLLARLSAERGQYEDSLRWLKQGIELDTAQGDRAEQANKLLDRAYVRYKMSEHRQALEDVQQALLLDASLQRLETASAILGAAIQTAPEQVSLAMRAELIGLEAKPRRDDFSVLSKITRYRIQGEILLAGHQWAKAIEAMRAADILDAVVTPREYLGRALELAALHESNPVTASELRQQAISAYAKGAQYPGVIWSVARQYPPGFLADELTAYLSVATLSPPSLRTTDPIWSRLKALRGSEPRFAAQLQEIDRNRAPGNINP